MGTIFSACLFNIWRGDVDIVLLFIQNAANGLKYCIYILVLFTCRPIYIF